MLCIHARDGVFDGIHEIYSGARSGANECGGRWASRFLRSRCCYATVSWLALGMFCSHYSEYSDEYNIAERELDGSTYVKN